jgi:hypothetical protein
LLPKPQGLAGDRKRRHADGVMGKSSVPNAHLGANPKKNGITLKFW